MSEAVYQNRYVRVTNNLTELDQLDFRCQPLDGATIGPMLLDNFAQYYEFHFKEDFGLSFRTSEESLRNAFKDFGQLLEVNLVMDKIANRPRGFAFLRYATEDESQQAIDGMHGKVATGAPRMIFSGPAFKFGDHAMLDSYNIKPGSSIGQPRDRSPPN
ncbi:hypothetical protein ACFE04_023397 [Oxalis oulophora]